MRFDGTPDAGDDDYAPVPEIKSRSNRVGSDVVRRLCDVLNIDTVGLTGMVIYVESASRGGVIRVDASYIRLPAEP